MEVLFLLPLQHKGRSPSPFWKFVPIIKSITLLLLVSPPPPRDLLWGNRVAIHKVQNTVGITFAIERIKCLQVSTRIISLLDKTGTFKSFFWTTKTFLIDLRVFKDWVCVLNFANAAASCLLCLSLTKKFVNFIFVKAAPFLPSFLVLSFL